MGGLNQGVTVVTCRTISPTLLLERTVTCLNPEGKWIFSPASMKQRARQGNVKLCVASRGRAVTVSVLCPVIVLCCRCACMCINVRLVIYGISWQCGHYRGNTGHPCQPCGGHHDHPSKEEDPAAPAFHQQEEHAGEIQVMKKKHWETSWTDLWVQLFTTETCYWSVSVFFNHSQLNMQGSKFAENILAEHSWRF